MNYSERYLIEATWNKIAQQMGSSRKRSMTDINNQLMEKDKAILKDLINNKGETKFGGMDNWHKRDAELEIDINQNCIFFYYIDNNDKRVYVSELRVIYYSALIQFLDLIRSLYIEYIGASIVYSGANASERSKVIEDIDFKGLTLLGCEFQNVRLQNVTIDYDWIKNSDFNYVLKSFSEFNSKRNYDRNESDMPENVFVKFTRCIIGDNVIVQSTQTISITECWDFKDFSFIKKATNYLHFGTYDRQTYPDNMNLYGLPEGNYELSIKLGKAQYEKNPNATNFKEDDLWTFEGMPDTISKLKIFTNIDPKLFFPHFSFKGIPLSVVDKIEHMNIYVGAGTQKHNKGVIRCGYKEKNVFATYWKVNKKELADVLRTNDFFLDFWFVKNGPNREYIPPQQSDAYAERVKKIEYKKYDANKREEEEEANKEFLIKRVKKYLKVGERYPYKPNEDGEFDQYFTVVSMNDKEIEWKTFYRRDRWDWNSWNVGSGAKSSYDDFVNGSVLNQEYMINGKTFRSFFKEYVHKRLLKVRKERRKKDNAKEKEAQKQEQQKKEPVKVRKKKTFNFDEQLGKKETKPVPKMDGIEVVDYKERSYAVFGNTYDIKDQLKELGAYYNKFLNYEGRKRPGWIVSKKKKDELEKIIGPF